MSVIASMLEEHREEQEAAEKRRKEQAVERKRNTLGQAHIAVEDTLGAVFEEIREENPDTAAQHSAADDGLVKALWWDALTWDGMPPFQISARAAKKNSRYAAGSVANWDGRYDV